MRASLSARCVQFTENREIFRRVFRMESTLLYPIGAAMFADRGLLAGEAQLLRCKDLLAKKTGLFSDFRGTARLCIAAKMALDADPEAKLNRAQQSYGLLREQFSSSDFLPVVAMILAEQVEESRYEAVAQRTRTIYKRMREEHPFLTSREDSVFAALLALSERSDDLLIGEVEDCYRILKPTFFSADAVQSLSHVLALCDGESAEKCRRTVELFENLKARGCRYGTNHELATLGLLAMLPQGLEAVMEELLEVDEKLAGTRGYGLFGLTRKQRLMHAGMLVCSDSLQGAAASAAAVSGTVSLIAAQQAAICAAIASAAAANSSANN